VVVGADAENLKVRMREAGLEAERFFVSAGARGGGPALYVRDPDGHLIEPKIYGP
jgi:catechol 2,3-dioxygenase-like lactoylglutathione lyase family enzyme